uniref:Uncharacterized protein n=1 Tax=mine drainage metagenome TaxID=410659 RepID=E6QJ57_9ZZZZ
METSAHEASIIVIKDNTHHDSDIAFNSDIMKRVNFRNDRCYPAVRFMAISSMQAKSVISYF